MRLARALVVTGSLSILRVAACTPFSGGDGDEAVDGGSDAASGSDGAAHGSCDSANAIDDKASAAAACLSIKGCEACFMDCTKPRAAEFQSCADDRPKNASCQACADITRRCAGITNPANCSNPDNAGDLCVWVDTTTTTPRCRARCAEPPD